MIIYGIKNCDTMKKAFDWLDANGITYSFHNYKTEGISKAKVEEWLKHFATNELINTKGTTFRALSEEEKASITNKSKAVKLMMTNTSLIKRPVLETGKGYMLGFKADDWAKKLL